MKFTKTGEYSRGKQAVVVLGNRTPDDPAQEHRHRNESHWALSEA